MSRCLTCAHYAELSSPIKGRALDYTGVCADPLLVGSGKANLCASTLNFASGCHRYESGEEARAQRAVEAALREEAA